MPGWITVFRAIPWVELIAAAPAIARGARKLWTGIRKSLQPGTETGVQLEPEDRLERLELQVGELKKELAASSEIITALAEQNERLVEVVGILRVRVLLLLGVCVVTLVLGAGLATRLWAV